MMTTPHSGLVLGCYNVTALAAGIARRNEIWGVTDDSVVLPAFRHCELRHSHATRRLASLIQPQGWRTTATGPFVTGVLRRRVKALVGYGQVRDDRVKFDNGS